MNAMVPTTMTWSQTNAAVPVDGSA